MSTTTQEQAFDAAAYELPIPRLDGHKADKLTLAFSGSIELDRTSEDDLELIESMRLGRDVTLQVTATVARKGFTLSAGKDDAPEQTGYGVGLKVHTLEEIPSE